MQSRKEQIIELWKTVFNDSDEFMRLYFEQVYKTGNAFVIEKNGRVISSLQMHPYRMSFCGEDIPVGYISGACTLPSERGKGWMSTLLQNTTAEMKRRNIPVAALIPAEEWLFDYYRSRGYTETFCYLPEIYVRSEDFVSTPDGIVVRREREPHGAFYDYFDRKLRERPLCILHTYEDFAVILQDLELSDGSFFVATHAGCPVGMAFVSPGEIDENTGEQSLLCKEILYNDEDVKRHVLSAITHQLHADKAVCRIPSAGCLPTHPYGMAKVIDPEPLIGLWMAAHPGSTLSGTDLKRMDRRRLTHLLFNYPEACMSLMLD
ncbi:MAG: GNAT family N-acetyltransferase [Tannerellaceae bacterium]|jgi:hypothetical protein|nr:GNAT family N-acetyltransferase [Tannerellaceae bacterium]